MAYVITSYSTMEYVTMRLQPLVSKCVVQVSSSREHSMLQGKAIRLAAIHCCVSKWSYRRRVGSNSNIRDASQDATLVDWVAKVVPRFIRYSYSACCRLRCDHCCPLYALFPPSTNVERERVTVNRLGR